MLHPIRVMLALQTNEQRTATILHDVVEDTDISFDDLMREGFPSEVILAVRALTKLPRESRADAAMRAAENQIACQVKLADVEDNMDLSRISNPKERDFA